MWHLRAGFAMPEHRDTWWTLRADTDLEELATELVAVLDESLLPVLRAQSAAGTPND